MRPDSASATDLLNLLASIENNVAKRAMDSKIKHVLTANARRATLIADRLTAPTVHDWRAYLETVVVRDDRDPAKDFLYGADCSYKTESVSFAGVLTTIVREFLEFTEETCKSKR